MIPPLARIRRFRFNRPQRIAAGLLALFLLQGLWLTAHQTLSDRDYQYARCGREVWERPSALVGYYTTCGNIRDGILVYRLSGLPLTVNFEIERVLDHFRKPEDRVIQVGGEISPWELRHQITHVLLLLRLPFLLAGCALGAGLWWVTRRLYGNLGGYTALSLYCFSPPILRACVTPSAEILAALAVYGGVYTCIGVAHAMQGPRRNPGPPATGLGRWGGKPGPPATGLGRWGGKPGPPATGLGRWGGKPGPPATGLGRWGGKPGPPATGLGRWGGRGRLRIVLLACAFGMAATSHIAALPVVALLGLFAMLWIAEGRRAQVLPVVLIAVAGALVILFACYGFSPDAFSYVFRSAAGFLSFSFDPARRFFTSLPNAGLTIAAAAALALYCAFRRSRYFGNTAPLLCFLVVTLLVMTGAPGSPWLWAIPFLLTFIGGVFADAYESPRGRLAMAAGGAVVGLQVVFCGLSLAGLL